MKKYWVSVLFMVTVGCFEPRETELEREFRIARERSAKQAALLNSPAYQRKVFNKLNKANDPDGSSSLRIP